jgi:hypothetical protein
MQRLIIKASDALSLSDSIEFIVAEKKLSAVYKAFGMPALVQAEMPFLKEYVMVMAPMIASLDFFQGD